jgi:hypothetical protein
MALEKFKAAPLPNPPSQYDPQYLRQLIRVIEIYFSQLDSFSPNQAQSYRADAFYGGTFDGTDITGTNVTATNVTATNVTATNVTTFNATTTNLDAINGHIDLFDAYRSNTIYTDTDAFHAHTALIEDMTIGNSYGGTYYGDGRWLQLPYNQLSSDQDQTAASVAVAYAITLNTNEFPDGISIVSNSRITFAKKGIYNIAYSIQFKNTHNDLETIDIWLRRNGTDVANTNTRFAIPARKSTGDPSYLVAVTPIMVNATADNQYFELMWRVSNTGVSIEHLPAVTASPGVTPAIPATPSVIVGVTHVSAQFPPTTRVVPLPVIGFGQIGNVSVSIS